MNLPPSSTASQEAARLRFLNALNEGGGVAEAVAYLDAGGEIDVPITPIIEHTLLHYAAEYRHLELVQMLASRGANLNIDDSFGMTPMHLAVQQEVNAMFLQQSEPDFPCARLLMHLGASLEVMDNHGRRPRDLAGLYGPAMLDLFDEVVK